MNDALQHYLEIARAGDSDAAFHGLRDLPQVSLNDLTVTFRSENDPEIRGLILRVAKDRRVAESLELFSEAITDPNQQVFEEAMDGLVSLGTPDAKTALNSSFPKLTAQRQNQIRESLESF
jgi:hypothetical protein